MAELHSKTMISTGIALQSYRDSIHLTINPALSRSRRKTQPPFLRQAASRPTLCFLSPSSCTTFLYPIHSPGPFLSTWHPPRPSHLLLSYHFLISSFPNPPARNPPPLHASRSLCPVAPSRAMSQSSNWSSRSSPVGDRDLSRSENI